MHLGRIGMKAREVCPLLLLLTLLFALCCPASADIIYVKPGGPGPDGKTWATAFATIQAGVNAAASEAEKIVWVQKGTYTENVSVLPQIKVYGGFKGHENPPESNMNPKRHYHNHQSL